MQRIRRTDRLLWFHRLLNHPIRYLFIRDRHDLNTRAAGTVAAAVAIQAVWAPLVFSKISFLLLPIDTAIVGSLLAQFVPGASWSGLVVTTPSGHNVEIFAGCASFHNLSLASLCWVTLTMLHRPYGVKSDLYVGLVAALIQFGLNIWRLVFVCLSLPMYEFWHEGLGKHIFSAVATECAIIFVQAVWFIVTSRVPKEWPLSGRSNLIVMKKFGYNARRQAIWKRCRSNVTLHVLR
jgi:hypothetical protein